MKNKTIIGVMPLVIISLWSLAAFIIQISKSDFSAWQLYAAGLGFVLTGSLAVFCLNKVARTNG